MAVVCACLLAFSAANAGADDSSPVLQATIYGSGGQTTNASVSPASLLADPQQCPVYSGGALEEHGRQGVVSVGMSPTRSWTLSTVLGCLAPQPIPPSQVTAITVVGDEGTPLENQGSQISASDLGSAIDPVIQSLGSTDQYDRPWRGGSDLDYLDETQTTPIAIEIFEGTALQVTASASQTTVTAGSTISFNASVSGGGSSSLTYNWSFDGGAPNSTQAAPQVQFASPGVWTVQVQVISSDGGTGGAQLTVTVNPTGTSSTPTTTGKTTTGPTKSKGPTPKGNPSKQRTSGAPGTTHGHGTGTNTSTTQTTTTQTSTTQTTATQSTTSPAASSSGGNSSGSSGGGAATPTTVQTTPAKAHHKARAAPTHHVIPAPHSAAATVVTGQLISDVIPLPADRSPLVHLASAGASAPARQAPEGPSPWPIAIGVLAILALLGLGAQRELGRPRWSRLLHVGG